MIEASTNMAEFVIAHQQLESTLREHPMVLKEWNDEVVAWEKDPSKPNPFEREVKGSILHEFIYICICNSPSIQGSHEQLFKGRWLKTSVGNLRKGGIFPLMQTSRLVSLYRQDWI